MRIEITGRGIYGVNGEIPVGTVIDVKAEPKAWGDRYRVLSGGKAEGKAAVTNPAPKAGEKGPETIAPKDDDKTKAKA